MLKRISLFVAGLMLCAASVHAQQPSIQFGTSHGVALRNNGDVLTWGNNVFCQLGRPSTTNSVAVPEVMMRNVKEIAVAVQRTMALTVDGKLYGWGAGALGMGNGNDLCEGPELLKTLEDKTIAHIAAGYYFSLAVTTDGDLYCTGDNDMGQCPVAGDTRATSFVLVPYPELAKNVATVTAGMFHALVTTKDGKLYAFGRGRDGQIGNGKTVNGFAEITELKNVVSMAAGTWHNVVALADGSVWTWGNGSKSQLCDGGTANRATPARVDVPGQAKVTAVFAAGLATVMKTADGSLYACGDNQFGPLGLGAATSAARPTQIPIAAAPSVTFWMSGGDAAVSADGCAVRMSGVDDNGLINANVPTSSVRTFTPRANLSLCGTRPAQPLPTLVRVYPKGGESGCWTPRVEEDAAKSAKYLPLREAQLAAENILKTNAALLATIEPSRFRTSLSIGPSDESGARMHVKVVPERKRDGTRLWTAQCGVIPQVDRIGGASFQISIFFNDKGSIGAAGTRPKRTGTVGGYPEYDNWVVITRDGRLPWIPVTLADKLDEEGARRETRLADWTKSRTGTKVPDQASLQKTYEMLKTSDPAGAEKFLSEMKAQAEEMTRLQRDVWPAETAALQKQVNDYKTYRASFTAEQLGAPAVLGDTTGAEKRTLDAKLAALRTLPAEEQQRVDDLGRRSRDLERQAQEATRNRDTATATRLRAEANALALEVRTLRNRHQERINPQIADANAQYDLTNLKPGAAEQAIAFKADPAFPDSRSPNRIQLIRVVFSVDPDVKDPHHAWQQRVKDTFDYAALAALLK